MLSCHAWLGLANDHCSLEGYGSGPDARSILRLGLSPLPCRLEKQLLTFCSVLEAYEIGVVKPFSLVNASF